MGWIDSFMQFGPLLALFGLLGVTVAFLRIVRCFRERRYVLGLLFTCLELLSAVPLIVWWMCALKVSGKTDWYLLGLLSYPFPAICFYALFAVGAVCAGMNIWGIAREKKTAGPSSKEKADGGAPAEG